MSLYDRLNLGTFRGGLGGAYESLAYTASAELLTSEMFRGNHTCTQQTKGTGEAVQAFASTGMGKTDSVFRVLLASNPDPWLGKRQSTTDEMSNAALERFAYWDGAMKSLDEGKVGVDFESIPGYVPSSKLDEFYRGLDDVDVKSAYSLGYESVDYMRNRGKVKSLSSVSEAQIRTVLVQGLMDMLLYHPKVLASMGSGYFNLGMVTFAFTQWGSVEFQDAARVGAVICKDTLGRFMGVSCDSSPEDLGIGGVGRLIRTSATGIDAQEHMKALRSF